jgi:hypothetical protein
VAALEPEGWEIALLLGALLFTFILSEFGDHFNGLSLSLGLLEAKGA